MEDYMVVERGDETIELSWDGQIAYLWKNGDIVQCWCLGLEW